MTIVRQTDQHVVKIMSIELDNGEFRFRALDLGLIDQQRFFEFYRAYQNDERRTAAKAKGGGDFYNNQNVRLGKRFARAVMLAAKEGRLLYREAYSLTGLQGATFDKYAKELEIDL